MGNTLSCCQSAASAPYPEEHPDNHHDEKRPSVVEDEKTSVELSPGYEQLELKFPAATDVHLDEKTALAREEQQEAIVHHVDQTEQQEVAVPLGGGRRLGSSRDCNANMLRAGRDEVKPAEQVMEEVTKEPEAPTIPEINFGETEVKPLFLSQLETPVDRQPAEVEPAEQEVAVSEEQPAEIQADKTVPVSQEQVVVAAVEENTIEQVISFTPLPELQFELPPMENITEEIEPESPTTEADVKQEDVITEHPAVHPVQPEISPAVEETVVETRPASLIAEARASSPVSAITVATVIQSEPSSELVSPPDSFKEADPEITTPPASSAVYLQTTDDVPSPRYSISVADLRSSIVFNTTRNSNRLSTQSNRLSSQSNRFSTQSGFSIRSSTPPPQAEQTSEPVPIPEPEAVPQSVAMPEPTPEPTPEPAATSTESAISVINASLTSLTGSLDALETHLQTLSMLHHYTLWESTMRLRRELKAFISAGADDFYVYDSAGNVLDIDIKAFNRAVRGFEKRLNALLRQLEEHATQEEQEETANPVPNEPNRPSPRRTKRSPSAARGFWQQRENMMASSETVKAVS